LSFRFKTGLLAIQATDGFLLLTAVDESVEIIVEEVVYIFEEIRTVSLVSAWHEKTFRISLFYRFLSRVTYNRRKSLGRIFSTMVGIGHYGRFWRRKSFGVSFLFLLQRFARHNLISAGSQFFVLSFAFLPLLFERIEVLSDQRIAFLTRLARNQSFDSLHSSPHIQQIFIDLTGLTESYALGKHNSDIVDIG
jgi:hypothetical protein